MVPLVVFGARFVRALLVASFSSFPRRAWEQVFRRSASRLPRARRHQASGGLGTQSVQADRSHAERGNEETRRRGDEEISDVVERIIGG
jgi:hypothetical protein